MTVLIQHLDGVERDFATTPLPRIAEIGVGVQMKIAFDKAVNMRQIVAVMGPKGIGKSHSVEEARTWFAQVQASRLQQDAGYTPQKVVVMQGLRGESYDQVLAAVIHALDSREPMVIRGKSRGGTELRQRACQLLADQGVVLLVVDEMELASDAALRVVRDVVAMSADLERQRTGAGGQSRVYGIGAVLVGAAGMDSMLHKSDEYGQRIVEIKRISPLTIEEATVVLETWLPQAKAFKANDAARWRALVRQQICHDGPTTMRHLESIVREYGRCMDRAGRIAGVTAWTDVPVVLDVLGAVAAAKASPNLGINVVRTAKAKVQNG